MPKKHTIVHRYKNHFSWQGKKYENNRDGIATLYSEIQEAGFPGVHINDHRKRKKVSLTPREQM